MTNNIKWFVFESGKIFNAQYVKRIENWVVNDDESIGIVVTDHAGNNFTIEGEDIWESVKKACIEGL